MIRHASSHRATRRAFRDRPPCRARTIEIERRNLLTASSASFRLRRNSVALFPRRPEVSTTNGIKHRSTSTTSGIRARKLCTFCASRVAAAASSVVADPAVTYLGLPGFATATSMSLRRPSASNTMSISTCSSGPCGEGRSWCRRTSRPGRPRVLRALASASVTSLCLRTQQPVYPHPNGWEGSLTMDRG